MTEYIDLDTPLELKVWRGQTYKLYTSTLRELLDVNSIPYTAADVRAVVKAKWEEVGGEDEGWRFYRCTICGAVGIPQYHYCPNCGADMRGEE